MLIAIRRLYTFYILHPGATVQKQGSFTACSKSFAKSKFPPPTTHGQVEYHPKTLFLHLMPADSQSPLYLVLLWSPLPSCVNHAIPFPTRRLYMPPPKPPRLKPFRVSICHISSQHHSFAGGNFS